jgi:hypothetical protein
VYFTKLLQEKNEVTMHQFYSSVGVELMQKYGALIFFLKGADTG